MDSGLLKQFKSSGTSHGWFGGESSGWVDFTGDHLNVFFETEDGTVIAKLAPDLVLSVGGGATLLIKAENCVVQ